MSTESFAFGGYAAEDGSDLVSGRYISFYQERDEAGASEEEMDRLFDEAWAHEPRFIPDGSGECFARWNHISGWILA